MQFQTLSFPNRHHPLQPIPNLNFSTHSGFLGIYRRKLAVPRSGFVRRFRLNCVVECHMKTSDLIMDDGFYIRRAVELARKATGFTSPNPMVGCVIVKDGEIVGEGFHPRAGQPHAEVFALRDAGELAENATAYVSLEPCNHFGRTPPCSDALIKAKVKRVVVGMVDPNPIVTSKGVEKLRNAGIEVTVSVEEELCKRLNEAYIHKMLTGKPFVTLRYTMSVNGYLIDQLGEGAVECGGYFSKLLEEYDAVILSGSSVKGLSSLPISQEPGANQPVHILIATDPKQSVPFPVVFQDPSKAIIFTDKESTKAFEVGQQGIETVVLDQINFDSILEYCNRQGNCSVLLDLRGNHGEYDEILRQCLKQNLIQKVVVEILPIWDGGHHEASMTAWKDLKGIHRLKKLTSSLSGDSAILEGYF